MSVKPADLYREDAMDILSNDNALVTRIAEALAKAEHAGYGYGRYDGIEGAAKVTCDGCAAEGRPVGGLHRRALGKELGEERLSIEGLARHCCVAGAIWALLEKKP